MILITAVTLVEVTAVIAAKHRIPGGISLTYRQRALARFLQDCHVHFALSPLTRTTIDHAVELTQLYRLRGYDAVQLASALALNMQLKVRGLAELTFVASDVDLLTAAQAEMLVTENPLQH